VSQADPAAGVAVSVWLFPIAEPQAPVPALAHASTPGPADVAAPPADPGPADVADSAIDAGSVRGARPGTSGATVAANHGQIAPALPSFGEARHSGALAAPSRAVTIVPDAPFASTAPHPTPGSANDAGVAGARDQSLASAAPTIVAATIVAPVVVAPVVVAPVVVAPAGVVPAGVAGVVPAMNMRGAMTTPLERAGAAYQSAVHRTPVDSSASAPTQTVPADVPVAPRAGSDRLPAPGRAAGGTMSADDVARRVTAAFDPGTAGSNDQSGTNAGREFSNRAAAFAPARENRGMGSPSPTDAAGRPDVAASVWSSDVAVAATIHADRAPIAEGHGVAVAVAGAPLLDTAAAAAAPSLAGAVSTIPDEADVRRQIVQAIKFQWRDGSGDVKLTLQPDYLGDVAISLRVEQNGGVTAHVNAAAADVRAWIGANEPLLRQGLAEQGLALDRLVIAQEREEATSDRDGRHRQPPQEETPEKPPQRRERAIFEVIV
jgi:hypothetical protein